MSSIGTGGGVGVPAAPLAAGDPPGCRGRRRPAARPKASPLPVTGGRRCAARPATRRHPLPHRFRPLRLRRSFRQRHRSRPRAGRRLRPPRRQPPRRPQPPRRQPPHRPLSTPRRRRRPDQSAGPACGQPGARPARAADTVRLAAAGRRRSRPRCGPPGRARTPARHRSGPPRRPWCCHRPTTGPRRMRRPTRRSTATRCRRRAVRGTPAADRPADRPADRSADRPADARPRTDRAPCPRPERRPARRPACGGVDPAAPHVPPRPAGPCTASGRSRRRLPPTASRAGRAGAVRSPRLLLPQRDRPGAGGARPAGRSPSTSPTPVARGRRSSAPCSAASGSPRRCSAAATVVDLTDNVLHLTVDLRGDGPPGHGTRQRLGPARGDPGGAVRRVGDPLRLAGRSAAGQAARR